MARQTQDVASPQISTLQRKQSAQALATPTIVSPPRSSRSPSLSFAPQVKIKTKPLVIPSRSQNSISNLSSMTSPRNSPPPDFLLDDDPFANLTGFGGKICRQLSGKATAGDVKISPRSRLLSNDNNYEPLLEDGPS